MGSLLILNPQWTDPLARQENSEQIKSTHLVYLPGHLFWSTLIAQVQSWILCIKIRQQTWKMLFTLVQGMKFPGAVSLGEAVLSTWEVTSFVKDLKFEFGVSCSALASPSSVTLQVVHVTPSFAVKPWMRHQMGSLHSRSSSAQPQPHLPLPPLCCTYLLLVAVHNTYSSRGVFFVLLLLFVFAVQRLNLRLHAC
jgi:hypothetical protein